MENHFKGKQYDYRIIIEAVGLYYHFPLSYRDCAKIMRKFSIHVHHTTIYRWCQQYGKVLYHLWKKRNKRRSLSQSWRKLPYGNSFQSTYTVATAIKGIEVVSGLYKESRREIKLFDFSPWEEIENLLKTA